MDRLFVTDGDGRPVRPWRSRGYLPHVDIAGLVQFITFRLADALPRAYIEAARERQPDDSAEVDLAEVLDAGHGSCVLRQPGPAGCVEAALLDGDGDSYRLIAWVVMPNHVHALIEPSQDASLGPIVQRWKGTSARHINKLLGRTGQLWQREYHDRFIRNERHLRAAIEYAHGNSVNAGLCETPIDWPFSSARHWENLTLGS